MFVIYFRLLDAKKVM